MTGIPGEKWADFTPAERERATRALLEDVDRQAPPQPTVAPERAWADYPAIDKLISYGLSRASVTLTRDFVEDLKGEIDELKRGGPRTSVSPALTRVSQQLTQAADMIEILEQAAAHRRASNRMFVASILFLIASCAVILMGRL